MRGATLVRRGLVHYRRTHAGVVAGAALATAILVGALLVGAAVRAELAAIASARLGSTQVALQARDRFCRAALADELAAELKQPTAALMVLRGNAEHTDDPARRANRVEVLGVDARFWALSPSAAARETPADGVWLSRALARRLGAAVGQQVLLRVERPSLLPADLPLARETRRTSGLTLRVLGVLGRADFGRFGLHANQLAPMNAFVDRAMLADRVELAGKANTVLIGGAATPEATTAALAKCWTLEDADLELRQVPDLDQVELRSRRVYLEPPIAEAVAAARPDAVGVLSYMINRLSAPGGKATPYSIVSAIGPLGARPDAAKTPVVGALDDEGVLINSWMAEDLGVRAGPLQLSYYEYGPARTLIEKTATLQIRGVVPLNNPRPTAATDRTLMPEVPGLSDADSLMDWDSPIPIDSEALRDKDDAYWKARKGTPKAFVTLATGQRLWDSRFGGLTSVRFPGAELDATRAAVRAALAPGDVGLALRPVADQARASAANAIDFGGLFGGLSFFLIAAALILVALLFALGVEQRRAELGLLLAVGMPPSRVRRLLLVEGGLLALVGSVVGTGLGVAYTWGLLRGLATVWQGAVAGAQIPLVISPATLAAGPLVGTGVALGVIWLVARKAGSEPPRALLTGASAEWQALRERPWWTRAAVVCLLGALALPLALPVAGAFFGAGGLLLVGALLLVRAWLARLGRRADALSLAGVARSATTRRAGRSLAVVGLLACGSFLVVAVSANRKEPPPVWSEKSSGTGGFAFYGESALPLLRRLDEPEGRERYGLADDAVEGATIVPMRVRDGDDASCLNLNQPLQPRLLGVDPAELTGRFGVDWNLLKGDGEAIPAIGDAAMIQWSLMSSVGSTLTLTDGRGRPLKVRLVGAMRGSVLQSSLLIAEDRFLAAFPSEPGYRAFLVDPGPRESLDAALREAPPLADAGMELVTTTERLAAYNAVENTYLTIFGALGGLGLLLGSVGIGLVVARNVLERRGELAALRAIGFDRARVRRLIVREHTGLLTTGLAVGAVCALIAVAPALAKRGALPFVPLAIVLTLVAASGLLWTALAASLALRGDPLDGLRQE